MVLWQRRQLLAGSKKEKDAPVPAKVLPACPLRGVVLPRHDLRQRDVFELAPGQLRRHRTLPLPPIEPLRRAGGEQNLRKEFTLSKDEFTGD